MSMQIDPERNEAKTLQKFADFAGRRVLEVGCGDGRLTWSYASAAQKIIGIDLNESDLRVARIERPSDLSGKTFFAHADSIHLPFANESFEAALLTSSL